MLDLLFSHGKPYHRDNTMMKCIGCINVNV